MNRITRIQEIIVDVLETQNDLELRKAGYVHLYGVSNNCALLALKRGLNVEIASILGLLHDIHTYKTGSSVDHAKHGATLAKDLLVSLHLFTHEEIELIQSSISTHSNKHTVDLEYNELLKDADVLQHYLFNPTLKIFEHEKSRLQSILIELGITNNGI